MPEHKSLSDLLAEDVRDYFLREGQPVADPTRSRKQKTPRRSRHRRPADVANSETLHDELPSKPLSVTSVPVDSQQPQQNYPHMRHGSAGSESLGSAGSRSQVRSAADAEFLRQYAADKQQTNHRMAIATRPIPHGAAHTSEEPLPSAVRDVHANQFASPYHSMVSSPRPPKVVGSHRPGLPSIDNDDWEEDDKIERRDRRKLERKEARRKTRKQNSLGGNSLGSSSCGRKSLHMLNPMNGSLCYSTGSSSQMAAGSSYQKKPLNDRFETQQHNRLDSHGTHGTFVIQQQSVGAEPLCHDRNVGGPQYDKDGETGFERGHVRPLSYLSDPSSDSGNESRRQDHENERTRSNGNRSFLSPSNSSSSGTFRHPLHSEFSSGSDLHSSLLGSAILDYKSPSPAPSGEVHGEIDEGSYDSESTGSSYTSSYDSSSIDTFPNKGYGKRMMWGRGNYDRGERSRLTNWNRPTYASTKPISNERNRSRRKLQGRNGIPLRLDDAIQLLSQKIQGMFVAFELLISNMPSLVGSLALAWVSLGVDWFKWYEETFDACHPTHYHNKACVFPEFPGCFVCDAEREGYQLVLRFHYICSTVAFVFSSFLVGKTLIAFPVVRDELANPTTAAPLGLLMMALEKVFAGNFGIIGKTVTYVASGLHAAVAMWFIFISIMYRTLPEPSWFSNTTGIGLAAAKMYLYWTPAGYTLCILSTTSFVLFYFVALYRIHTNVKISVPVCWVQLSGPAVVLYGFTIFSQPGSDEDDLALLDEANKEHFFSLHRKIYMPIQHTLFACCLLSMVSSLYLLQTRWKTFREKEFSPAHVSFCAPLVSHANALQAYRSSLQKFSQTPIGTHFKLALYQYWVLVLVVATILVAILTTKFLLFLPQWCQLDVDNDEMPPEPEKTIVTQLLQQGEANDTMNQHFVSAAVLQANESGALVRVLQDGRMKYVRSRRMPSMGFDPILNVSELMSERERLLQNVKDKAVVTGRDRGGLMSFDANYATPVRESKESSGDSPREGSGGPRRRLNFLSFDASTMMRGDHS